MVRYLFRTSYIGTKYRGTQKMLEYPNETVQHVIERALLTLNLSNTPCTCFASRTDKGVHALMNAFHVDLEHKTSTEVYPPHTIRNKINTYLAENNHEISIINVCVVPKNFHARFHAKWRSYCYRLAILRPGIQADFTNKFSCQEYIPIFEVNRCHVVTSELNTNIVKRVTDLYYGEHDFATFTKYLLRDPWKNSKRVIEECRFYETSNHYSIEDPRNSNITMWEFYIQSRSFLYHQVRKLIGAALSAGLGLISISDVESMLNIPGPRKWTKCFLPPPGGLYLTNVKYDKKAFENDFSQDFEEDQETAHLE